MQRDAGQNGDAQRTLDLLVGEEPARTQIHGERKSDPAQGREAENQEQLDLAPGTGGKTWRRSLLDHRDAGDLVAVHFLGNARFLKPALRVLVERLGLVALADKLA